MGYFNLVYTGGRARSLEHTLNRTYRGAILFALRAPDAEGVLKIWARSEAEAREHLVNACFDLIFKRSRVGAHSTSPDCLFCGSSHVWSRGRNSSGNQTWQCRNPECLRAFVVDRNFRGGINHPSQSKKPAFAKLILDGVLPIVAADRLGLNHETAKNWAAQVARMNRERMAGLSCPCGKPIRHRGTCVARYTPEGLKRGADKRRCGEDPAAQASSMITQQRR